ncbi:MAG: TVP38/TMEM64 family protein [Silicimonas sp.]|nr:TVP38/TMEM64 family protein [Silicimonas sp.]
MMFRLALLLLLVLALSVLALPDVLGFDIDLPEREDLERWIDAAGLLGPILVVALMTAAIVASPLPSAPIALAAGAAYGHTFGTLLVVFGAELGALAAFLLARGLGRPFVERHFGQKTGPHFLGSQNTLTFLVFGSRLLPFLSFDMISYAAGLSKLQLWRFALATLAGIIPASFLLAHLGSEAMNGDARTATWTAVALGGFTALSLFVAIWRERRPTRKES